jgi:hypothetical protein
MGTQDNIYNKSYAIRNVIFELRVNISFLPTSRPANMYVHAKHSLHLAFRFSFDVEPSRTYKKIH